MVTDHINDIKLPANQSRVSIWLDSYDDVFSDFDSRPFNERSLSDDFITEARKMAREKPEGEIELKLLMPDKKRDKATEAIIIRNLHSHFRHFEHLLEYNNQQMRRIGFLQMMIGFALMIFTAFIIYNTTPNFGFTILRIVLEPSGWFIVWTGLENIFESMKKQNKELEFTSKMAHAKINFDSF